MILSHFTCTYNKTTHNKKEIKLYFILFYTCACMCVWKCVCVCMCKGACWAYISECSV